MKNIKLSKKMIVVIVIAVLLVGNFIVGKISNSMEESAKKKEEEKIAEQAEKLLKDKVEVPDTFMKSKEEVKLIFDELGLKAEFVIRDMDEIAKSKEVFIKKDMCDSLEDAPNVKYYDYEEVGIDKSGYYVDKGATLIVGYSDHDIDGTIKVDTTQSGDENPAQAETETNSDNTSGVPSDLSGKVEELNRKYDELITKANGYVNNPSTFTLSEYSSFMSDYTDILSDYGELSDSIDSYENQISSWDSYDIWMNLINKNIQLIEVVSKLPDIST